MAITLSSTKITTASVNTSVSANFAGPVDFSSAVISGESDKWQIVSADSNLSVNRNYFANTTGTGDATGIAMTLTLPASANVGDTITVIDQTANAQSNNVVIARNGNSIDGANRNVILNVQRGGVRLVYTGTGWTTKKVEQETRFSGAQGETSGYVSGGNAPSESPTAIDDIEKFSFAVDTNSAVVANLFQTRSQSASQSSLIFGYTSGGTQTNTIDKFPFASDANATDVGNITETKSSVMGSSSQVSGYTSGGYIPPVSFSNVIDKFPFSTDTNASDVGDLTLGRSYGGGHSSRVNGYVSGGDAPPFPTRSNVIDKFPFSSDTNATDVGDLTQARTSTASQSSDANGYTSGGYFPGRLDTIDKFSFSSDVNSTDVGNLTQARSNLGGSSSTISGYTTGGQSPTIVDTIDKFPFVSDANATDVGNLSKATVNQSNGNQV